MRGGRLSAWTCELTCWQLTFCVQSDKTQPSQPHSTLADFELNSLAPEGHTFSSFTYRIAAAQMLGKVNNVPEQSCDDCEMLYNDADLTREILIGRLPRFMKTIFNEVDGTIDPMIFQTQMLIQA